MRSPSDHGEEAPRVAIFLGDKEVGFRFKGHGSKFKGHDSNPLICTSPALQEAPRSMQRFGFPNEAAVRFVAGCLQ
jgi:hypothetical protein